MMAKLTKVFQNIFGSAAGVDQIAQFGSKFAGTPTFSTSPVTVQALSNFLSGWFAAVIATPNGPAPCIEDMNALFFLITYQLAYASQAGIPEWDASTIYFTGSLAQVAGVIYVSRTDNNSNNLVTDTTNWTIIGGAVLSALGDIIYGGTNGAQTSLAIDLAGKVLRSNGTQPSWQYPEQVISSKTSNYTVVGNDNILLGDSSGGAFTFTLPSAASVGAGKTYKFLKTSTDVNVITITDGTFSSSVNTQQEMLELYTLGSSWSILNRRVPSVFVPYTPTITNFGSVSAVQFSSRRVGDSLEILGKFTSGVPVGGNAQITYGFNGVDANVTADTAKVPGFSVIGSATTSAGSSVYFGLYPFSNSANGANFFNFGSVINAGGPTSASNANGIAVNGSLITVHLIVPITGWH